MYTPQDFQVFLYQKSYTDLQQHTPDMVQYLSQMIKAQELVAEDAKIRPGVVLTVEEYNHASTVNMTDKDKAAVEAQNKRWHDWKTNQTHLSYNKLDRGIAVIGTAVHEAEHANQTTGYGYSPTQVTMLWIARALYEGSKSNALAYRNNYAEIAARLAEAKFYLESYKHMKDSPNFTVHEKDSMLRAFMDNNYHLCRSVTEENLKNLLQSQIRQLKSPFWYHEDCKTALKYAFPQCTAWTQLRKAAIAFLETEGQRLNDEMYREVTSISKEMKDVIHQLEKETTTDRDHTIAQDKRNYIAELARNYHIPFIDVDAAVPFPQHADDLESVRYGAQLMFESAKENYYNPAIVTLNGTLHLIYDDTPQERPYGPKPQPLPPTPENHLDLEAIIENADPEYATPDLNHIEQDLDVR